MLLSAMLTPYRVTMDMMKKTGNPDCICKRSKVFDEAEDRMHTIKAVMVATAGK